MSCSGRHLWQPIWIQCGHHNKGDCIYKVGLCYDKDVLRGVGIIVCFTCAVMGTTHVNWRVQRVGPLVEHSSLSCDEIFFNVWCECQSTTDQQWFLVLKGLMKGMPYHAASVQCRRWSLIIRASLVFCKWRLCLQLLSSPSTDLDSTTLKLWFNIVPCAVELNTCGCVQTQMSNCNHTNLLLIDRRGCGLLTPDATGHLSSCLPVICGPIGNLQPSYFYCTLPMGSCMVLPAWLALPMHQLG